MNKKLPAALCILLTIPIMVSATTYISIDIQDNKSVNNEKKDYPTPDRNKIIAFPGADGAGKYTTGGAGGTVYIVTSLADDGSEGTFRWAINQKGTRTIVFAVDGIIELQKPLRVNNGDLTIAGQTAPGDGICLKNYTFSIQADNVIVRFIRSRMGVDIKQKGDDAMNGIKNHQNIIIDHCSMSWSTDECATFYNNRNFTLQWCIISESLANSIHEKGAHGYGGIWGGQTATFHHNLLAHHTNRTPRLCGSRYTGKPEEEKVDLFNNVIYNYGSDGAYAGEGGSYNIMNNYYKLGPASAKDKTHARFFTAYIDDGKDAQDAGVFGYFYVNGNIMDNTCVDLSGEQQKEIASANANNTSSTAFKVKNDERTSSDLLLDMRIDILSDYSFMQSATDAYETVLAYAGAWTCGWKDNKYIIPERDKIDRRIVSETTNGTYSTNASKGGGYGLIDSQVDTIEKWDEYITATSSLVDTDKDGIPDGWEIAKGLNPNDASDGAKYNLSAAYTNLEVYLNGLVENTFPASHSK